MSADSRKEEAAEPDPDKTVEIRPEDVLPPERPREIVSVPGERYRLGAELGRGGLGRVVEAFDSSLEREVAVKLTLEDAAPDGARRFAREARLAGKLEHPNIVPVYDFGELCGGKRRPFLAMKRGRGRDLGKVIAALAAGDAEAKRVFTQTRLLQIFQDICLGIAFAHDRGVFHRDLKPANVMLGDFGEVQIVDWGLAVVAGDRGEPGAGRSSDPDATQDGEVMGTPAFMPPEQAEGRMHDVDRRSDIYSLGAIRIAARINARPSPLPLADGMTYTPQISATCPRFAFFSRSTPAVERAHDRVLDRRMPQPLTQNPRVQPAVALPVRQKPPRRVGKHLAAKGDVGGDVARQEGADDEGVDEWRRLPARDAGVQGRFANANRTATKPREKRRDHQK